MAQTVSERSGLLTRQEFEAREDQQLAPFAMRSRQTRGRKHAEPEDEINEIMETMTEHRVRHIPVVREGRLQGIVSIGDVVKALIADSKSQINFLKEFIYGPGLEEKESDSI